MFPFGLAMDENTRLLDVPVAAAEEATAAAEKAAEAAAAKVTASARSA